MDRERRYFICSGSNMSEGLPNIRQRLIKNDGSGRCGLSIHLTPTKRKRTDNKGKVSTNALQGRCKICSHKTTMCCSKCEDDDNIEKAVVLCNPKTNRMCFATHVETCIDDDN